MQKRVKCLGYEVTFNPPGESDIIASILCLGGKCLRNRNERPEEGDLLLFEEPPVDVSIQLKQTLKLQR